MLYLPGIGITFFLALILASKKENSLADKILALWLAFTGLHLFLYYIYVTDRYLSFPYLLGFEIPIPLLHGPFLFLYTSVLTNSVQTKKINGLHFIPFTMAIFSLIPFYILPLSQKIEIYQQNGKGYELLMNIIFGTIAVSGIFYTLLSLHRLAKHRKAIPEQFSYTEKINLRWLSYLILGSSIIWLFVLFSTDKYVFSAVVIYVLFIGYFGIKQVGIFTNKIPPVQTETLEEPSFQIVSSLDDIRLTKTQMDVPGKIKYEKSRMSDDEIRAIHQKLSGLMSKEKKFKAPELSLSDLAQMIEVHPNTLSQVINSVEQKNFYDYINQHRVDEFKRLIALPESQKFTILTLAFECGFNSKTSFNRNFKKVIGLSPSEYVKQINIDLA